MKDYQVLIKMTYLCDFFSRDWYPRMWNSTCNYDHRHTVLPLKRKRWNVVSSEMPACHMNLKPVGESCVGSGGSSFIPLIIWRITRLRSHATINRRVPRGPYRPYTSQVITRNWPGAKEISCDWSSQSTFSELRAFLRGDPNFFYKHIINAWKKSFKTKKNKGEEKDKVPFKT